ncbi:M56 family metallopeptidase [Altericroceibacterium endophyticum]|uniref:Antirepressor regulating drug resistance protein n=1 Tax=Altericroceibacterium endophyticum TaxID=1808508 RepID=A0A6I4T3X8_9SPHN|nr:M56 family metallopeptidase [Altericroceibacterium endophyticum]MXO64690.1 antirepressor regulating drug resistance protein [Altericroceibacterium endophyticum]
MIASLSAFLIDTLIYTGLMIALVLLLRQPVAAYFGASYAYALWLLPFMRFLMPPIVLPAEFEPTVAAVADPQLRDVPTATMDSLSAPTISPAADMSNLPIESAFVPTLAEWAIGLWLAGSLGFLVWRAVQYRAMRRELLAGARPMGEAGDVRLVESPSVTSPVALGVFDKVVALPERFMVHPHRQARDLAIAHELAHHHGRDLLANIAAQPLLALHWFNPLAWLGWRAMRRDQEAACDARVVVGRSREERATYAQTIAGFAQGRHLALAAPMACPVLGEKSIIHRLRSLARDDLTPRRRVLGRSLIGAAALVLPFTASISYADSQVQDMPAAPSAPPAPSAEPVSSTLQAPVSSPIAPQAPAAPLTAIDPDLAASPAPPVPPAPSAPPAPPAATRAAQTFSQRMSDLSADRARLIASIDGSWSEAEEDAFDQQMDALDQQQDHIEQEFEVHLEWQERQMEAVAERQQRQADKIARRAEASARHTEKVAMRSAIDGLIKARDALTSNAHIPAAARKDAVREINQQIAELSKQI